MITLCVSFIIYFSSIFDMARVELHLELIHLFELNCRIEFFWTFQKFKVQSKYKFQTFHRFIFVLVVKMHEFSSIKPMLIIKQFMLTSIIDYWALKDRFLAKKILTVIRNVLQVICKTDRLNDRSSTKIQTLNYDCDYLR